MPEDMKPMPPTKPLSEPVEVEVRIKQMKAELDELSALHANDFSGPQKLVQASGESPKATPFEGVHVVAAFEPSPPRFFRPGGRPHYKVKLRLAGPDEELRKIRYVNYKLPAAFREPVRTAADPTHGFETEVWTYGKFDFNAEAMPIDGAPITLKGKI